MSRFKLTFEQAEAIRAAHAAGTSAKNLAAQYQVTRAAVYSIINFRSHRPEGMDPPIVGSVGRPRTRHSQECECGCGQKTSPGRRYLSGHNARVDDRIKASLLRAQIAKTDAELLAETLARTIPMDLGYETACFVWLDDVNPSNGYPSVSRQGTCTTRHRLVYSILNPDVDLTGQDVHHLCHAACGDLSRRCLRPSHLTATGRAQHRRIHGPDQSHLTQEQVDELRDLRAHGIPVSALADRYNLTTGAVYSITAGYRWKDQHDAA